MKKEHTGKEIPIEPAKSKTYGKYVGCGFRTGHYHSPVIHTLTAQNHVRKHK